MAKKTIFGPIWTQFRSKQLKIWPESHFWSDRLDLIESIQLSWSDQKWHTGQTLRPILSPNWTKNGKKSIISTYKCLFCKLLHCDFKTRRLCFRSSRFDWVDSIEPSWFDWTESIQLTRVDWDYNSDMEQYYQ